MSALPEPYASCLPPLLAAAFSEDLPDLTAPAVFEPGHRLRAVLLVKAPGVICGLPAFAATFELLDGTCEVTLHTGDGDRVQPGTGGRRGPGRRAAHSWPASGPPSTSSAGSPASPR